MSGPYLRIIENLSILLNSRRHLQILATDLKAGLVKPPPMQRTQEKVNLDRYYDFHLDRGQSMNDCYALKKQIEDVIQSRKLIHLIKDIRAGVKQVNKNSRGKGKEIHMVRDTEGKQHERVMLEGWMNQVITFPPLGRAQPTDELMVVTA